MRLRRRPEFLHVQDGGQKLHGRYLFAVWKPTSPDAPGRVGFTVTKKIGNAVVRNRIRRVLREWLRTNGWVPCGRDYVFVAKAASVVNGTPVDAALLRADIAKLMNKP